MSEELLLSAEQVLVVIAIMVPILIWLIRKPVEVELVVVEKVPVKTVPERNLRYLQIHRYYGG